jgi:bifunctional non-homologous end joining protein LigD
MGLQKYKEKRDFKKTPEPEGKEEKPIGPLRFVIQKHEATRLHYDFRLEMGGVMKSWAVPKGPSLDPEVKRLAMETEDHPISYNKFEGIIPQGQYGGGKVMIWDSGNYVPEGIAEIEESDKKALEMYHKGEIKFVIKGEKIKGGFALVKTHLSGEENAWLLIKHKDQFISKDDITQKDKSVTTGRSLKEIEDGAEKKHEVWNSNQSAEINSLPNSKFPKEIKPMLATLIDEPFDNENYIFEIKWDGYRAISEIKNGEVNIYSRNQQSFNEKYKPIHDTLKLIKQDMVLDGEIVVVDKKGKANFGLLQNYGKTKDNGLMYYVFDILYLDGKDLQNIPLFERKQILQNALPDLPNVKLSSHIETEGKKFFKAALRQGLEGIMGKNKNSIYRQNERTDDWVKVKTKARQEAIICGFTEPRGSRKYLGALILGAYENNKLKYIGHTGGKINEISLKDLRDKLDKIETSNSPFEERVAPNAPVHWVKPIMVCEVTFQEWTEAGIMRIPIFEGLREDKDSHDVSIEKSKQTKKEIKKSPTLLSKSKTFNKNPVSISNPDKVLWPDEGYTKMDLLNYYKEISDFILPYLKDRPESLKRNPNGVRDDGFFQKDVDPPLPNFVETIKIKSDSENKEIDYLLCQNVETLLYMANLGCIEINPWNSTINDLDKPTWLVIDLDPLDVNFQTVVDVAITTREVLEKYEIPGYPKTSGASGIHVYIPMGNNYTSEQARQFAEILVKIINTKLPEITSIERNPNKRRNRVYLDYLQNRSGQTVAAPYCLRPKPGATVSTPLKWVEVNKKLTPQLFDIRTIFKRLEKVGDLWKPVLGDGIDLSKALKTISKNAEN